MEKFLAFDSSGEELMVGCFNGEKYFELRKVGGGTELLLPLIDKVLKKAKMQINDVEVVCVGVGPGSWTGSRVAVVTAYGMASANNNLKFAKFNSFDLISYNGSEKEVVKLVKAYANFVYAEDSKGEILALTKDELRNIYRGKKFVSATDVIEEVSVVETNLKEVAFSLTENGIYQDVSDIEPMYLRLSQAEYQRKERMEKADGKQGA